MNKELEALKRLHRITYAEYDDFGQTLVYSNDKLTYDLNLIKQALHHPTLEERYQARLDKVLSKFEKGRYLYGKDGYVVIEYYNEQFYVIAGERNLIALNTVESLLEDLDNATD